MESSRSNISMHCQSAPAPCSVGWNKKPIKTARDLPRGTVAAMLNQAGPSREEFLKLL
jgi:hypothetical protein